MPVKKRTAKGRPHRITGEAVEAYRQGDYMRLHRALGLMPWECSPLPVEVDGLGVDQGPRPSYYDERHGWEQSQELQRELEKATKQCTRNAQLRSALARVASASLEKRSENRNHRRDRPHRSQACNQAPVGRTPRRGSFAFYRGNSLTGEGLKEALTGANVVVDVTNSPSFEDNAVLDFFRSSTGHLLSAAAAAGVSHYVALSVVGLDRIRDSGYLRAKHAQEGMIEAGGVPYTVLRATQFFEFLKAIADGGTEGNVVHLSPSKFQPVAADDVAATLAEIATAQPKNGVVELAGPDAFSMAEFIQSFLSSVGDKRKVVPDPDAKYFGAVLDKDGLAP